MNPLSFSRKPKKPTPVRPGRWTSVKAGDVPVIEPAPAPIPKLSVREELAQQARKAKATVTLRFVAAGARHSGDFVLPYCEGQNLRSYLLAANKQDKGLRMRAYDKNNMEKGRLRQTYTPGPNSVIEFWGVDLSPVLLEKQAKKVSDLKLNLTRTEATMSYGQRVESKPPKGPADGVDQW